MQEVGFPINFAYILEAYALGSKTADEVVHYVPSSKGPNNGQRIFFDDSEKVIRQRLQMSCDEALRYFCKVASISGYLLNREHLEPTEIETLFGRKLKKETIKLVLGNIVRPFQETTMEKI